MLIIDKKLKVSLLLFYIIDNIDGLSLNHSLHYKAAIVNKKKLQNNFPKINKQLPR